MVLIKISSKLEIFLGIYQLTFSVWSFVVKKQVHSPGQEYNNFLTFPFVMLMHFSSHLKLQSINTVSKNYVLWTSGWKLAFIWSIDIHFSSLDGAKIHQFLKENQKERTIKFFWAQPCWPLYFLKSYHQIQPIISWA